LEFTIVVDQQEQRRAAWRPTNRPTTMRHARLGNQPATCWVPGSVDAEEVKQATQKM
jgi:hypothetical protein